MSRLGIATIALATLSVACGDDAASTTTPTTMGTTTTSTTATSTTSLQITTTTSATTTTGASGSRCDGLASMTIPEGVTDLVRFPGSFDGDPQPESIQESDGAILFEHGGAWWFGFSLHTGYVALVELPEPSFDAFEPEIHSVRDFGDLDDGVLVKIDHSTLSGHDVYSFYFLDAACQVEDAGTETEDRVEFLVGFGASHREGLSCADDGVWETTAGDQGGGMWTRVDTFFEWDPTGHGFIEAFSDGFEAPADDADIEAAGDLDC